MGAVTLRTCEISAAFLHGSLCEVWSLPTGHQKKPVQEAERATEHKDTRLLPKKTNQKYLTGLCVILALTLTFTFRYCFVSAHTEGIHAQAKADGHISHSSAHYRRTVLHFMTSREGLSVCQESTFYSDLNLLFASWEVIGACRAGKCVTRNYAWSSRLNRKLISNLCAIITHLRNHKLGWICGEVWIVPASETLITSFSKREQANTKLPNKNHNHTLAYPHTYRHHQSLSEKWNNGSTVTVGKVSIVQGRTALKWVVHFR